MSSPQGIRAGAAYVEITTRDASLKKGLQAAERRLKAWGASIAAVGAQMFAVGGVAMTPFLGAAKVFTDMGSDALDMSQRTGISVEKLSELGYAADQTGTSLEGLEGSVKKMQKAIAEAATGSASAQETLAKFGLSVDQLLSLSPDEQLKLFGDRISQIRDPAIKAAAAMSVFGKSGTDLLPLFTNGAQGISELQRQARDLGLVMSTEDAVAAETLGDSLATCWKIVKQMVFSVGAALAPVLQQAANLFVQVAAPVIDWIKNNQELIATVFKVAAGVAAAGAAMIALGGTLSLLGTAIGGIVAAAGLFTSALGVVGSVLGFLLTPIGAVVAAVVGLGGYLVYTSGIGEQAINWLKSSFMSLWADVSEVFGGIKDAMAAGDFKLAAQILWLGIKMEWQKGVHWLTGIWLDFKNEFLGIWTETSFFFQRVFVDAVAGLQTAWTNFTNVVVDVWQGAISLIAKGIASIMGWFDKSIDVEATIRTLDEDFQKDKARRENEANSTTADLEKQRAEDQKQLERDRLKEHADRDRAARQAQAESDAQLKAAMDAFKAARQEAKQERDQAARLPANINASGASLANMSPEAIQAHVDEVMQGKFSSIGTFNPFQVAGLGGESYQRQIAKATELTAAEVRKLNRRAANGLVFK